MNRQFDEDSDFTQLMAGKVRPVSKGRDKASLDTQPAMPSEAQLARRASAEADAQAANFLSDEFVDLVASIDPIEYRRDGIQTGVLDRLRQGGYAPQARLHLIKRPLRDCRQELFRLIEDASAGDLRCLLVVHGRGRALDSHANVVRSYVAKWLQQFDQVQAYASAVPSHGGIGATYVMLRKSERERARNRERQQKRRG